MLTGTATINGTGNALDNTLTGNASDNVLRGGDGNDIVAGSAGNDTLRGSAGDDTLRGGAGNDWLAGGTGADQLSGGAGADVFHFPAVDSTRALRDLTTDFETGVDVISLAGIDAIAGGGPANDTFAFLGSGAFTAAGQVRVISDGAGAWLVQANRDANLTTVELEISVASASAPGLADLLL